MKFGGLPCCSWQHRVQTVSLLIMNSTKLCWAALYCIYLPISFFSSFYIITNVVQEIYSKSQFLAQACWWVRLKEVFIFVCCFFTYWLSAFAGIHMHKHCLCSSNYMTSETFCPSVWLQAFFFNPGQKVFGMFVRTYILRDGQFEQKCADFYFLLCLQTLLKQWTRNRFLYTARSTSSAVLCSAVIKTTIIRF